MSLQSLASISRIFKITVSPNIACFRVKKEMGMSLFQKEQLTTIFQPIKFLLHLFNVALIILSSSRGNGIIYLKKKKPAPDKPLSPSSSIMSQEED